MSLPRPLVATPCSDSVKVNYFTSFASLTPYNGGYIAANGGTPDLITLSSSLVTLARTALMLRFLEGDWTHLFFIDSDVGFTPANFKRVLNSGFDICAAPYPKRKLDGGYPIEASWVGPVDRDGFAQCLYVPTGFTCIKRSVFDNLLFEGFGKTEIFDTHRDAETDEYFSEDIAFSMRCREIGIDIWIDTKSDLGHMGHHEFTDDFSSFITKGNSNAKTQTGPAGKYRIQSNIAV